MMADIVCKRQCNRDVREERKDHKKHEKERK